MNKKTYLIPVCNNTPLMEKNVVCASGVGANVTTESFENIETFNW